LIRNAAFSAFQKTKK